MAGLDSGTTARDLAYVRRRYISVEAMRRAVAIVADGTLRARNPVTFSGLMPIPYLLITDYRDRVRAAHLKDVHAAAREKSRFESSDYRQATGKNHVWTELGRGDVDLVGVLKALPDVFDGWLVVEVDVPDLGTPAESTHASARWIRTQPLLQGGLV